MEQVDGEYTHAFICTFIWINQLEFSSSSKIFVRYHAKGGFFLWKLCYLSPLSITPIMILWKSLFFFFHWKTTSISKVAHSSCVFTKWLISVQKKYTYSSFGTAFYHTMCFFSLRRWWNWLAMPNRDKKIFTVTPHIAT